MYNTIIFDLDGTLLDTLTDLKESVNHTLATYNMPLKTIDEIRSYLGNGMERLVELSVEGGKAHPLFDKIYKDFKDYYFVNSTKFTKPYDGVIELLTSLKEKGYKLAIVSNKGDEAVKLLRHTYFEGLIEIAIGEKTGIRRKPYPDTAIEAMHLLNSKPEECLYVGDSEVDIETAHNASLECVSCSWGFRTREQLIASKATTIINKPLELLNILEK